MSSSIRVGIDGSESSRAAVRWAMKRLTAFGISPDDVLTLVHVVDDEWGMVGSRNLNALRADGRALARREAEYACSLAPGVAVATEVLTGNPLWELAVTSVPEMMTVVGTHKTGYVRGRVFGSRSLQLAAAARGPVAIIPQSCTQDASDVVVGVDNSPAGRAALRFAAEEAARTQQGLTLVRAWPPAKRLGDDDHAAVDDQDYAALKALGELSEAEALARTILPHGEIRLCNVGRSPAEALLDAASRASLLVIGATRRTGPERMVLGSVSHDVLLNLAVPTVVVHAPHSA